MPLTTYAELKTEIAEYIDDDTLNDRIDTFIDLAEAAHRDEVRFREIIERATITLADGDRTEALPADFAEVKYIRFNNPSTGLWTRQYLPPLVQVTEDQLTDMARNQTGYPKYFCITERIEFNLEADQDYTGEMVYYKTMTPLSDANTSNELLVRSPDLYLFGALKQSAPFFMHDERLQTWGALYDEALRRLNTQERVNRRSGPQRARAKGV